MSMAKFKTILSTSNGLDDLTKMINDYFYSQNYRVELPNLINEKIKQETLNQYKIEYKNGRYKLLRTV